jgi:Protein of unknown function (DUF3667)
MSGEMDALGAAATAGLAAGVIEGREPSQAGEGACANCDAKLEGRFCAQCGQAAHPHRSLAHVFEEFLHGVLHFDTKAWRTLPMLLFRPGTLTRNYVYGKRARYISPLALFLFTVFFMFFVFAFMHAPTDLTIGPQNRAEAAAQVEQARAGLQQAQEQLAELRAGEDNAPAVAALERVTANTERELFRREAELAAFDAGLPTPSAEETQTEAAEMGGVNSVRIDGMPELSERIREKLGNPELALYKIQQTAYKFSFLLAPISLPFIALLFLWKRGLTLYDHVVYALYGLSFAALVFVAAVLLSMNMWTAWAPTWLVLSAIPIHTFFHLRGAYALGWWSAAWRTLLMLLFAVIALTIFIVAIVLLGLTG